MERHDSPGMETTGDVRMVDHGDELLIRTAFEVAVALTQVDVDEHFALGWCHIQFFPLSLFCENTQLLLA